MAHPDYTKEDIVSALRSAGLTEGDTVFTHSNIGFFGVLEGTGGAADYYRAFKDAMFSVIGASGTWIVPTFSYSFCRGESFDPAETPSVCGMLSEMLRKDPEAVRSADANFSVAAIGKRAKELTENAPEYSFGQDSFWERFLRAEGKICNFNFDAGSTFVHYVERCLKVPYRYDKPFPGPDGRVFYHFVYDLEKPLDAPALDAVDRLAKERGMLLSVNLGKGQIVCIAARTVFSLVEEELKKHPYFLTLRGQNGNI